MYDLNNVKEYFTLVPDHENLDAGLALISITQGTFKDCLVKFLDLKLNDDDLKNLNDTDTTDVGATFSYEIVSAPEELQENEISDEEGTNFEFLLGQILMVLVEEYAEDILNNQNKGSKSNTSHFKVKTT